MIFKMPLQALEMSLVEKKNLDKSPATSKSKRTELISNFQQIAEDIISGTDQSNFSEIPKICQLCRNIDDNVWINPENAKVKQVQRLVEELLKSVLERVNEIDTKWDFTLIKCGSYYEGSRVGPPYEFDYMLLWNYVKVVSGFQFYWFCSLHVVHIVNLIPSIVVFN